MTKEEYADYLKSNHWIGFSGAVRREAEGCEECGITDTLNVHHLHYRSLYHEKREDVRVLCERCHLNTHPVRCRAFVN